MKKDEKYNIDGWKFGQYTCKAENLCELYGCESKNKCLHFPAKKFLRKARGKLNK